jgi:hypothetical protein
MSHLLAEHVPGAYAGEQKRPAACHTVAGTTMEVPVLDYSIMMIQSKGFPGLTA